MVSLGNEAMISLAFWVNFNNVPRLRTKNYLRNSLVTI